MTRAAMGLGLGWAGYSIWRLIQPRWNFSGKVVLIAGGSRGLGLILARQLARKRARLVLCARSEETLERARQELETEYEAEVLARACDLTDPDQVASLVREALARFGRIDVLINNASIIQVGPLRSLSRKDFRDAMEANFWCAYHATTEVVPVMIQQGRGRIINITSIGGTVAVPHISGYTTAKFAAVGFSQSAAVELASKGIKVLTVVPGLMRTGSYRNALFKGKQSQEYTGFSLAASLPLVTMDADRAAEQIIRACEHGRSFITLGMPFKLLRVAAALFPQRAIQAFSLVNRFLPKEPATERSGKEQAPEPGHRFENRVTRSRATRLGAKAARRNLESA